MAAGEWSGHVFACGLDGLGLRLGEGSGIPRIVGNAPLETLLEAGLDRAGAVTCVEEDDLASLETALLLHELLPDGRLPAERTYAFACRPAPRPDGRTAPCRGRRGGHRRRVDAAAQPRARRLTIRLVRTGR